MKPNTVIEIQPLILGSGRSGKAIAMSLACVDQSTSEITLAPPLWIPRNAPLRSLAEKFENPVLFIANPHGLHSRAIVEADKSGFKAIACEKPSCVNLQQLHELSKIQTPVAIFHVYRQLWGPQTLHSLLKEGVLGKLISIEGKYWQASTAVRSMLNDGPSSSWKNDPKLSGDFDAYLDLGTHWMDMASFLVGSPPERIRGWRSFVNSEATHRDSHVQLTIQFSAGIRGFCSISKNVHGATNEFEITLIGTKGSAKWTFLNPDEVVMGECRERKIITRNSNDLGSQLPPFHGLGWSQGYVAIISELFSEVFLSRKGKYPKLKENLELMRSVLSVEWED